MLKRITSLRHFWDISTLPAEMKPIISKLPYGLQEKWTNKEFSAFIRKMSQIKNNLGFIYDFDDISVNHVNHLFR